MPNEIYQLSDWVNAVKIKNVLDSNIKIDILALKDSAGYIMTIYEETSKSSNILYRVPVECSLSNNWSLATLEAIGLLNIVGFPCEWVEQKSVTTNAYNCLEQLQSFGWTKVLRTIRPADVIIYDSESKTNSLKSMIPNFNYKDWDFLTVNIPTSIEDLLNSVRPTEKVEENTTESE